MYSKILFTRVAFDNLTFLAYATVHYNPSDISSWLQFMIFELNPQHSFTPNNHPSSLTTATQVYDNDCCFDSDLTVILGKVVFPQIDGPLLNPQSKRFKPSTTEVSLSSSSSICIWGGGDGDGYLSELRPVELTRSVVLIDSQDNGVRLVHTLMGCAKAIQQEEMKLAEALLKRIGFLAISQAGAMRKTIYFSQWMSDVFCIVATNYLAVAADCASVVSSDQSRVEDAIFSYFTVCANFIGPKGHQRIKMELFGATTITRKIILESGLAVVDGLSGDGAVGGGSGDVVGTNDAPLTVLKINHYEYDHTSYTNFTSPSKCSACKCQDCGAKHDVVINVINALTAFVKELTSKRGVIPSKRILFPSTPLEIKAKRRRKVISKTLSNIQEREITTPLFVCCTEQCTMSKEEQHELNKVDVEATAEQQ
ncbi:hypothetical protein CQW23_02073 [Capsicum baccatum]|uniref:Transcriptional factor DELLA N-terminal domain-containing protein n=1 Tax=Capsicum baccatum TaxID=33114 RepID=A0A2G2XQG8_CAPBA|nr:hypothetical protein CQW23_02073 [Capsicum baccatum]